MEVTFERPEDGWIAVSIDGERYHISAVTNFLGDLVKCLTTFANSGGQGKVVGQLEPGTCTFVLTDEPPALTIETVYLNPNNKDVRRVDGEFSRRRLANIFLRALNLLRNSIDPTEFGRSWGFYFPDLAPLATAVRSLR